jgi:hypothetical protein
MAATFRSAQVNKSANNPADDTASAPKPGEPASTTDEAAFLAQQAADAKAAIARTLSEIGAGLGQSVNLSGWTRQYPWITLGASTIAGFVATAALVPSKEDQALRKLAKIERALNPAPVPEKAETEEPDGSAKHYKTGRQSFTRSILGELIKAVQPALLSMITAGVAARSAKPSQEEMQAAAAAEDAEAPAN